MSPNVIVTDEIGTEKDIKALYTALNGGVGLITTVHGDSIEDIKNMPRINSPRMFSSKNTIDKMAMETGLEEKSKIKCAKKHFKALG